VIDFVCSNHYRFA
jgi:hypothetical protein